MRRGAPGDEAARIRQRASGSGHQAAGSAEQAAQRPSHHLDELGSCRELWRLQMAGLQPSSRTLGKNRQVPERSCGPEIPVRSSEPAIQVCGHLFTQVRCYQCVSMHALRVLQVCTLAAAPSLPQQSHARCAYKSSSRSMIAIRAPAPAGNASSFETCPSL